MLAVVRQNTFLQTAELKLLLHLLHLLVIHINKDIIRFKPDKKNKMPSEAVSDGIFYFGARFGFPFAFPVWPPIAAIRMVAEKLGAVGISIIIMRIK